MATTRLIPCDVCGRTFMPESLARHEPICAKASNKKRKVFNSGKQRAEGSDVPLSSVIKSKSVQEPMNEDQTWKRNNWREKHVELVNAMRAARGAVKAMKTGGPLPPPPPPSINPDYIQCPYCSRRFNQKASERHIPFCREKQSRLPDTKRQVDPAAQRRMEARKLGYGKAKNSAGIARQRTEINTYSRAFQNDNTFQPYGASPTISVSTSSRASSSSVTSKNKRTTKGYDPYGDRDELPGTLPPATKQAQRVGSGRALRSGRDKQGYLEIKKNLNQKSNSSQNISNDSLGETYNKFDGIYHTPTPPPGSSPRGGSFNLKNESGYISPRSSGSSPRSLGGTSAGSGISTFCYECGTKYPTASAKFCCNCGVKRINIIDS